MTRRGPQLRNDPTARMTQVVISLGVEHAVWPDSELAKLDLDEADWWIRELRKAERSVRQLRKRLEALQQGAARTCAAETCGKPVTGRADAVYCSTACRVRAHRASVRVPGDQAGRST